MAGLSTECVRGREGKGREERRERKREGGKRRKKGGRRGGDIGG